MVSECCEACGTFGKAFKVLPCKVETVRERPWWAAHIVLRPRDSPSVGRMEASDLTQRLRLIGTLRPGRRARRIRWVI